MALLARDRCLPSAWEEGGGVTAAAGGPPVRAAGGPAGPGRLRLPAPRGLPALLGRELERLWEGENVEQDHLYMEASAQLETKSLLYCRSINWRVKTKRHRLV